MLGSSLFAFRMASSQKPCYFEELLSWQWGFKRAHPCFHKSCTETNGERLERGEAIGTPRLVWPLVPLPPFQSVGGRNRPPCCIKKFNRGDLKLSTRWWFWHHRHFFQSQAVCGWWKGCEPYNSSLLRIIPSRPRTQTANGMYFDRMERLAQRAFWSSKI